MDIGHSERVRNAWIEFMEAIEYETKSISRNINLRFRFEDEARAHKKALDLLQEPTAKRLPSANA